MTSGPHTLSTQRLAPELCTCHGEPMYWQAKADYRAGGLWRCVVKRRERQLRYWHKAAGGYIVARRRHLQTERREVLERLSQLDREAQGA